jgi:hypothetical protein
MSRRRYPFAIGFVGASVGLMALTAAAPALHPELVRRFGFGWTDLVHLQWWRMVTNCAVPARSGLAPGNLILPGVIVVLAERRWGTTRALVTFFAGDLASSVVTLAGLRLVGALGNGAALAAALTRDVGSSSGTFALAAALAGTVPERRRRSLAVAALWGWLAMELVVYRRVCDVQHLEAAAVGVTLASRWKAMRAPIHDGPSVSPSGSH